MKIITFLLLLSICNCSLARREILIGGIFHDDNPSSQKAFEYAVFKLNQQPFFYEFTYKHKSYVISRSDSFKAQEIACRLSEMGAVAIVGPGSVETSSVVESIADKLEIPHLTYHYRPKQINWKKNFVPKMTLNFYPDAEALSKAFSNVFEDYDWKKYAIVYENEENLMKLKDVLQVHQPKTESTVLFFRLVNDDFAAVLKSIKQSSIRSIVLDITTEKIVPFFTMADLVDMFNDYNRYFITNLDAHSLNYGTLFEDKVISNVTTLRLTNYNSSAIDDAIMVWKQREYNYTIEKNHMQLESAIIFDAVHFFANALKEYSRNSELRISRRSCSSIRSSSYNENSFNFGFLEFMRTYEYRDAITGTIEFDKSNVTGENANKLSSRTEFVLTNIEYKRPEGGWYPIAHWNASGFFKYRSAVEEEHAVLVNFQNKTFVIAVRLEEPFVFYRETNKDGNILTGNSRFQGFAIDLIKQFEPRITDFKYTFVKVGDNSGGKYDTDKKEWTGLVGEILAGRADLAISDLTITYDRKKVVDFTNPIMNLGIGILYTPKPDKTPKSMFSFLKPFKGDVWYYTGLAYVFLSFLVFLLSRINEDDWESAQPWNQEPEEVESIWNIQNCVWLMMGSIMGQGSDILPKGSSTRIVNGMWWFFALIMLASYTANLAAFLTADRMNLPVNSAEDLSKQSDIKYGAMKGGSTINFFSQNNHSTYQKMWAVMEMNGDRYNPISNEAGVKLVIDEKGYYAFMMESSAIEYQRHMHCSLVTIGGLLDSKGYGIAMPMDSPYRKIFNHHILKLQETYVINNLKSKWWKLSKELLDDLNLKIDDCPPEEVDHPDLDINNVGGVFIVLICGCLVAFVVAWLEFLFNVKKVALQEKITHWQALKSELAFAFNFWIVTKPVRSQSTELISRKSSPPRSMKSRSRFGSEPRSLKTKSTKSLNYDGTTKSLLNLR